MARNLDVATWWATERPGVFDIDLDSPACFACAGPLILDGDWNTGRLQRCHLTPRSLGGADTPGNLVLLCADCHRDAPDHANPRWMLAWVRSREHWLETTFAALRHEVVEPLEQLGVTADDIMRYLADPVFLDRARQDVSLHGGRLAPATFGAALAEHHIKGRSESTR